MIVPETERLTSDGKLVPISSLSDIHLHKACQYEIKHGGDRYAKALGLSKLRTAPIIKGPGLFWYCDTRQLLGLINEVKARAEEHGWTYDPFAHIRQRQKELRICAVMCAHKQWERLFFPDTCLGRDPIRIIKNEDMV